MPDDAVREYARAIEANPEAIEAGGCRAAATGKRSHPLYQPWKGHRVTGEVVMRSIASVQQGRKTASRATHVEIFRFRVAFCRCKWFYRKVL
jgi:hypothetical protein